MKSLTSKKHYLLAVICLLVSVGFDQFTKYLAVVYLKGTEGVDLIPGVFKLYYLENRGAAFGMLQNQQLLFFILTVVIVVVISILYARIPFTKRYIPLRLCAIFLIAGAIGNMIDRVRQNFVVDFLYFEWIDFPVFNVADIYVTVSTAVFIILILFYYKEEELELIKLTKKREH